jgi:hypothetical protein
MNTAFYAQVQNNIPSLAEKAALVYLYSNPTVVALDFSPWFPSAHKIQAIIRSKLDIVRSVKMIQRNIRGYFVRGKIYKKLIMNDYSGDPDTITSNSSVPILTIRAYAHNAQSVHYLYI